MKKHISSSWLLILFAAFTFTLTGCDKEGCTDPNAINFDEKADTNDGSCEYATGTAMLHMHPKWGDDPFTYGTDYMLDDGRVINFNIARFYMSQFTLLSDAGETALSEVYHQFTPSTEQYSLGSVNTGNYTGVRFVLGVDETSNTGDPSIWPDDHVLSINYPTFDHWNWNMGYVFMKLEGMVDGSATQTGTADSTLVYHVGTQTMARTVTINSTVTIAEGGTGMFHIDVDLKDVFEGLDMTQDLDTHTGNNVPLATQVADNFVNAITPE